MNDLIFYTGEDIHFEKGFYLHQPTIAELSRYFGSQDCFKMAQLLCMNADSAKTAEEGFLKVHLLSSLVYGNFLSEVDKLNIVSLVCLLFKDYKVSFKRDSLLVTDPKKELEDLEIVNENFELLQSYVHKIFSLEKLSKGKDEEFNPANDKAKEIAEKLKKRHATLQAIHAKENDGKSLLGNYLTILSIAMGKTTKELAEELTIFQLFGLIERLRLRETYEQLIKIKLSFVTAGSNKDPLEDWMKII